MLNYPQVLNFNHFEAVWPAVHCTLFVIVIFLNCSRTLNRTFHLGYNYKYYASGVK